MLQFDPDGKYENVAPKGDGGYIDTMENGLLNGFGNAMENFGVGFGHQTGFTDLGEDISNFGHSLADGRDNTNWYSDADIASNPVAFLTDPNGLAYSFSNTLGSSLGSMAAFSAGSTAGAALGTAIAPGAGTVAGAIGGILASGYTDATMEQGNTYTDAMNQGMSDGAAQDAMDKDFYGNVALGGVQSFLGMRALKGAVKAPMRMFGSGTDDVAGAVAKGEGSSLLGAISEPAGKVMDSIDNHYLSRVAAYGLPNAIGEGYTESLQNELENYAINDTTINYNPMNMSDDSQEQFGQTVASMIPQILLGGVGHRRAHRNMNQEDSSEISPETTYQPDANSDVSAEPVNNETSINETPVDETPIDMGPVNTDVSADSSIEAPISNPVITTGEHGEPIDMMTGNDVQINRPNTQQVVQQAVQPVDTVDTVQNMMDRNTDSDNQQRFASRSYENSTLGDGKSDFASTQARADIATEQLGNQLGLVDGDGNSTMGDHKMTAQEFKDLSTALKQNPAMSTINNMDDAKKVAGVIRERNNIMAKRNEAQSLIKQKTDLHLPVSNEELDNSKSINPSTVFFKGQRQAIKKAQTTNKVEKKQGTNTQTQNAVSSVASDISKNKTNSKFFTSDGKMSDTINKAINSMPKDVNKTEVRKAIVSESQKLKEANRTKVDKMKNNIVSDIKSKGSTSKFYTHDGDINKLSPEVKQNLSSNYTASELRSIFHTIKQESKTSRTREKAYKRNASKDIDMNKANIINKRQPFGVNLSPKEMKEMEKLGSAKRKEKINSKLNTIKSNKATAMQDRKNHGLETDRRLDKNKVSMEESPVMKKLVSYAKDPEEAMKKAKDVHDKYSKYQKIDRDMKIFVDKFDKNIRAVAKESFVNYLNSRARDERINAKDHINKINNKFANIKEVKPIEKVKKIKEVKKVEAVEKPKEIVKKVEKPVEKVETKAPQTQKREEEKQHVQTKAEEIKTPQKTAEQPKTVKSKATETVEKKPEVKQERKPNNITLFHKMEDKDFIGGKTPAHVADTVKETKEALKTKTGANKTAAKANRIFARYIKLVNNADDKEAASKLTREHLKELYALYRNAKYTASGKDRNVAQKKIKDIMEPEKKKVSAESKRVTKYKEKKENTANITVNPKSKISMEFSTYEDEPGVKSKVLESKPFKVEIEVKNGKMKVTPFGEDKAKEMDIKDADPEDLTSAIETTAHLQIDPDNMKISEDGKKITSDNARLYYDLKYDKVPDNVIKLLSKKDKEELDKGGEHGDREISRPGHAEENVGRNNGTSGNKTDGKGFEEDKGKSTKRIKNFNSPIHLKTKDKEQNNERSADVLKKGWMSATSEQRIRLGKINDIIHARLYTGYTNKILIGSFHDETGEIYLYDRKGKRKNEFHEDKITDAGLHETVHMLLCPLISSKKGYWISQEAYNKASEDNKKIIDNRGNTSGNISPITEEEKTKENKWNILNKLIDTEKGSEYFQKSYDYLPKEDKKTVDDAIDSLKFDDSSSITKEFDNAVYNDSLIIPLISRMQQLTAEKHTYSGSFNIGSNTPLAKLYDKDDYYHEVIANYVEHKMRATRHSLVHFINSNFKDDKTHDTSYNHLLSLQVDDLLKMAKEQCKGIGNDKIYEYLENKVKNASKVYDYLLDLAEADNYKVMRGYGEYVQSTREYARREQKKNHKNNEEGPSSFGPAYLDKQTESDMKKAGIHTAEQTKDDTFLSSQLFGMTGTKKEHISNLRRLRDDPLYIFKKALPKKAMHIYDLAYNARLKMQKTLSGYNKRYADVFGSVNGEDRTGLQKAILYADRIHRDPIQVIELDDGNHAALKYDSFIEHYDNFDDAMSKQKELKDSGEFRYIKTIQEKASDEDIGKPGYTVIGLADGSHIYKSKEAAEKFANANRENVFKDLLPEITNHNYSKESISKISNAFNEYRNLMNDAGDEMFSSAAAHGERKLPKRLMGYFPHYHLPYIVYRKNKTGWIKDTSFYNANEAQKYIDSHKGQEMRCIEMSAVDKMALREKLGRDDFMTPDELRKMEEDGLINEAEDFSDSENHNGELKTTLIDTFLRGKDKDSFEVNKVIKAVSAIVKKKNPNGTMKRAQRQIKTARLYKKLQKYKSKNTISKVELENLINDANMRHKYNPHFEKQTDAPGFSRNVEDSIHRYLTFTSNYVSKAKFYEEATATYSNIFNGMDFKDQAITPEQKFLQTYIKAIASPNSVTSFDNLMNESMKNALDYFSNNKKIQKIASNIPYFGRRLKNLQTLYTNHPYTGTIRNMLELQNVMKLGLFNPSSAFVQLSQLLFANAKLGGNKMIGMSKYFRHGMREAFTGKDVKNKYKELFDYIGIGDEAFSLDDELIGREPGWMDKKIAKGKSLRDFAEKSMIFFSYGDNKARQATAIGAYEKGKDEFGNLGKETKEKMFKSSVNRWERARDRAKDRDLAFSEKRPTMADVQKSYVMKYARDLVTETNFDYSVVNTPLALTHAGMTGKLLLQFKKYPLFALNFIANEDASTNIRLLVPMVIMAGCMGLPCAGLLDDTVDTLTGKSPGLMMRQAMMQWAGNDASKKALVNVAMYGAPSLAGINLSGRIGLGDAIQFDAGPTYSTFKNILHGRGVIKSIAPRAAQIESVFDGEYKNGKGDTVVKYNPYDEMLKLLGFKPVRETNASDTSRVLGQAKTKYNEAVSKAKKDYIKSPTPDNYNALRVYGMNNNSIRKLLTTGNTTTVERQMKPINKNNKSPEAEELRDVQKSAKIFSE